MTVGARIKEARKKSGMKQSDLAEKLGVAVITIGQYERDKREPSLNQLKAIAAALNADIVYLISGQTSAEVERGILIQAENEVRSELEKLQFKSKDRPYEERVSLSEALIRMFKLFGGFNSTGHKKAVERVEELTEIPRYRRAETTPQSAQMPQEGAELASQLSAEPQESTDTAPPPEGAESTQKPSEDKK